MEATDVILYFYCYHSVLPSVGLNLCSSIHYLSIQYV